MAAGQQMQVDRLKRREFISLVGGAAAAWPLAAHAQQPSMPVIGYLSGRSPDAEGPLRTPLLAALEEAGFVVGRNVAIEYRFADGLDERLPMLASDLVRRSVTLLLATANSSALAAMAATATIPILFGVGLDPVQTGLVASLNRPGGNATGVSVFTSELGPKRLGLLRELMPKPGLIAFVIDPNNTAPTPTQVERLQVAARSVGQPLLVIPAGTEAQVDEAFATMAQRDIAGIVFGASVFFQVVSDKIIALAAKHAIPAVYEWREFVTAGGLMSYSTNRTEIGRQMGNYAGRILKGANPADLPVFQLTKFEFVINMKTAKAQGVKISDNLLSLADEVIE
jgi:putative tryptophan/tyrosine transport system substrate-binding protein